jgi:hypothetical protein
LLLQNLQKGIINFSLFPKCLISYCFSVSADCEGVKSSVKGPVGKIEIWGTSPLYRLKQSFYLPGEFSSVEGLAWYKGRLFSCGTHGHLVEYDLVNQGIKVTSHLNHSFLSPQFSMIILEVDQCPWRHQMVHGDSPTNRKSGSRL